VIRGPEPWVSFCRDAVTEVQRVLGELPGRVEREPIMGDGKGGDETTAIDAAAEGAIVELLERLHAGGHDFHLVSEELGERSFGDNPTTHVVVDPIDGSVNAKRGIPYFSVSIAIADGPHMGDVHFGYVYDFGTGEEWSATRGGGAWLGETRLVDSRPADPTLGPVDLLSVEATVAGAVADKAVAFSSFAKRLRIMGSLALSLCHLAAGRVDAVCSLKEARAVDIAAAQLLLTECSLPIVFADAGPFEAAPLDVAARSPIAAAGTQELADRLAHIVAT
jgi:myo-inositol-1(or 4)-monophosphatase